MKDKKIEEKYDVIKRVKGKYRDVIIRKMPDGSERVVEDTGWQDNDIVVGLTKLLAGLCLNEPTFTGGILYSAQGRGDPAWDTLPAPPAPDWLDTALVDEYFRKVPTSIQYLDAMGNVTATITDRIQVKTEIDFSEANGEFIREQALFGGAATGVLDSGIMLNCIRSKARWKDSTIKWIRYIVWQF